MSSGVRPSDWAAKFGMIRCRRIGRDKSGCAEQEQSQATHERGGQFLPDSEPTSSVILMPKLSSTTTTSP